MTVKDRAFETVVLPHLDAAYTLARYLMRDEDSAQDVVQEAFLRALRHFDGYRGESARAWLLAIVRNCCVTWREQARRQSGFVEYDEREHVREDQEEATPEIHLLRSTAADAFQRALDALPSEAREMLVLREVEGLSYHEIAIALAVPIGTVMSRLSRARQRMRTLLRHEA